MPEGKCPARHPGWSIPCLAARHVGADEPGRPHPGRLVGHAQHGRKLPTHGVKEEWWELYSTL
ncbi:hypothetical protein J4464_01040 [Candidatus Woesearchaeota archaeon]|nr:hypothetical protein [Candidatus Woesearchaeota archaeon]